MQEDFLKGQIYLVKEHSDVNKTLSETDIINRGSNCAPLLINLFLYSYEAELVPITTNIVTTIPPPPYEADFMHISCSTIHMISFS